MTFDFHDTGEGPVLLFVPGSYSTASAWSGIQKALRGHYRHVGTSLPGYGGSQEIRSDSDNTIAMMSNFLQRVIDRAGAPVHLVGHSFGGLVSLAAALDDTSRIESLVTFEANPVFLTHANAAFAWSSAASDVAGRFERAWADGDADAPAIIIDYWSREGLFAGMPEAFKAFCRASVHANILDWRTARTFAHDVREFAGLTIPVTLVLGEHANAAMTGITHELARWINGAGLAVIPGADHFLITTHPADCARIIDDHMASLPRTS